MKLFVNYGVSYMRVVCSRCINHTSYIWSEDAMSKKIDEAFYKLQSEAQHHIKLSQAREDEYENGFAQGMAEALRIVATIRESSE